MKRKKVFFLHFARLLNKFFSLEKRNKHLFFSFTQNFRNFAPDLATLGKIRVRY